MLLICFNVKEMSGKDNFLIIIEELKIKKKDVGNYLNF